MKVAASLVLVSMLLGACAALAATAIGLLTSATISPAGGAVLGAALGLSGGAFPVPRSRTTPAATALLRAALAGATAALVVAVLQRP